MPAHKVKCLGEVDEGDVERHLLLTALLLELLNGEDHVHFGSLASEAALGFWVDALCEDLESDYIHSGKHLANDSEQGDASVVVAVAAITLTFVQGNDLGITHVLGHLAFSPTQTQEFVKWLQ